MMIFGFEHLKEYGASIRGRGNAAAHLLHAGDAADAVLEVGLSNPQRSSLESIYTLVFKNTPSLIIANSCQ
jgi:hypothetical protein